MRTRSALIVVAVFALCVWGASGGCASQTSSEQQLAVANDAFASTLSVLSTARESGQIDDATQTQVIAPARRAVDSLLDLAYAAVANGDKVTLTQLLVEIDKQLTPLLTERFKAQRKK